MQTVEQVRVQVVFKPTLIAMIERYRREMADLPSRAETVRRLCENALAQSVTGKSRGRKPARRTARR